MQAEETPLRRLSQADENHAKWSQLESVTFGRAGDSDNPVSGVWICRAPMAPLVKICSVMPEEKSDIL